MDARASAFGVMDRTYQGPQTVADAYDVWVRDGVLEHFWGEHIHHGYYPQGRRQGVDFRRAKVEMIERLLRWAGVTSAEHILDVGCGIGGSTRHLARTLGGAALGVTLSTEQVERAQALTPGDVNARFRVADAMNLPFSDASFDLVWSCESAEHMPDKKGFVEETVRMLKPGGTLVVATWCRRPEPLSSSEQRRLEAIYREWALPYFIPIQADDNEDDSEVTYLGLLRSDNRLSEVRVDDWSRFVCPTWPHQLLEGARSLPWLLRRGPTALWRSLLDARTVTRMIAGYQNQSIRYGVLRAERRVSA